MNPLGLPSGVVIVAQYDPRWAELYAAESARIAAVLAERNAAIVLHHTGSTSVPGLSAKAIIDILAERAKAFSRDDAIAAIQAAGYEYRGEQDIPGRDFFRRGNPRQYHLHLVEAGSPFAREHLTFRDHLRAHPDDSAAYTSLKTELARRFPRDREAYTEGKTQFVNAILAKAGITPR